MYVNFMTRLQKRKKKPVTTIPASWKLSPQQQAFIDAFAEDTTRNNKYIIRINRENYLFIL
ncbi:hypothetical protein CWS02_12610 [Enterobacter sp. EA-1]|nr:hypothetical protein CWS02_12610 [Enterobacter sp. EA-1]